MTGYAAVNQESASGSITIELKSVNSRFLDLQFRINDDFRSLEPIFREAITKRVSRGKLECRFSFGKKDADTDNRRLNSCALEQLAEFQRELLITFPNATPLSINELLRSPGVFEECEIDTEQLQTTIQTTLMTVLDAFITSREREGEALSHVLCARVDAMEGIVNRLTPLTPQVIQQFQQKVTTRLEEALGIALTSNGASAGTTITRDEALDRIRQEVTMYGIRIDIAEELARLEAHLKETRQILKKGGQVGKRLDFMMQELNREANTLGSKAAIKEIADASMELKLLIEQMREQVQNLE